MDEHNNNNNTDNERERQRQRQRQHHYNPIVLSQEGQKVLSIIESTSRSELPSYVDGKINEALNNLANEFLTKVKSSIVDVLFATTSKEPERGLTKIIIDKEWHKEEKKIETALRFFPDVILEKRHDYYPIRWMTLWHEVDGIYNMKKVSLIPLMAELGSELGLFDEDMRGGLLCKNDTGKIPLHGITSYTRNDTTLSNNAHLDACFLTILERLRAKNLFKKEDIQQYNILGNIVAAEKPENLVESRLNYFIRWDPTALSLPCVKDYGTCLPILYSTLNRSLHTFSIMFQAGMYHFPDKFGFIFCRGTQTDENDSTRVDDGTAFQFACNKYGHEIVTKVVLDSISDYYKQRGTTSSSPSSSSTSTSTKTKRTRTRVCTELSLLMSTITDETIHLDGLYILLRRDPDATLMQLRQHTCTRSRGKTNYDHFLRNYVIE